MLTPKQLTLFKMTRSEAGRKGYLAAIAKIGKEEFHHRGGQKTASMDMFSCQCHGVGVNAYSQHFSLKGKKHRYANNP